MRAFQGELVHCNHSCNDSRSTFGHRGNGVWQWEVELLRHPLWLLQALHRLHACQWKFIEVMPSGSVLLAVDFVLDAWFWRSKNSCCGVCSSGLARVEADWTGRRTAKGALISFSSAGTYWSSTASVEVE